MMDQLPRAPFESEDIRRALIEGDHRTVCRTQLAGFGADRITNVLAHDYAHVPLLDPAARIEPSHVQKTGVNLVPSDRVTARRAQVRDVRPMRPYGGQRTEVAVQGAVERGIEEHRRGLNVLLSRGLGSLRLGPCGPRKWRREADQHAYRHNRQQISPTREIH